MSSTKFASKEALSALESKYDRDEERREGMVRITEDGGMAEATLEIGKIAIVPDDFNPKKNALEFHFTDSSGEDRYFKFSLKWGLELKKLLEESGGKARVLMQRKGLTKEDTTYTFQVTGAL